MTLYDYKCGKILEMNDAPFYSLIQAAMRRADTDNLRKLKHCWPEIWEELQERYHMPGGMTHEEFKCKVKK